jgi:hypothetical protein
MTINQEAKFPDVRHRQRLIAAGGLLGALAASSCCILPLVLFSLGVSGAWIGNFTRLAPYQPYFIAATRPGVLSTVDVASHHPAEAFADREPKAVTQVSRDARRGKHDKYKV